MDSLKIQRGSDGLALVSHVDVSPCSHCSSFEHLELDCPVKADKFESGCKSYIIVMD